MGRSVPAVGADWQAQLRARGYRLTPQRQLVLEAVGDELLEPVIDGEYYRNLRRVSFRLGPRVRIPKVVSSVS